MKMPTQSRPAFRASRRQPWAKFALAAEAGLMLLNDDDEYAEDDMESADESEMAGEDYSEE